MRVWLQLAAKKKMRRDQHRFQGRRDGVIERRARPLRVRSDSGGEAALTEEPRPGAARKLLGKEEGLLVATACSSPPEGRARWTLDLLAGAMVKLTEHDSISRETVRRRLANARTVAAAT